MTVFRNPRMSPVLAVVAAVLFMLVAVQGRASAENLPVAAFFGTFHGSGIAVSGDSIYAPETARDMDVVVRPAGAAEGDGFEITWTTVSRSSTGEVKRKSQSLTFMKDGSDGRFRTSERTDAFGEGGLAWANIDDQTLNVFVMMVEPDGGYTLQRYARTLSGRGMELVFTRSRDGEERRSVKGLLVKVAK